MGWGDVRYCFAMAILVIILIILPHIFVCSISRRCLDQTLWNLVGISYAMWSCAVKGWFFQNGCRCHGNSQNAKKLKNTKMIITGYSLNRNWWNLIETTSTSSGMRSAKKIGIGWTNFAVVAMETKKGRLNFFFLFLSSNFMKLCRNIHRSVWQLLGGWTKFKMAAVAMVPKVQKMLNSLQIFAVMFPVTSTSSGTR